MKLQFKHQKFQADAAKAICDVFTGQPYRSSSFGIDSGYGQLSLTDNEDFLGYGNTRISNELNDVMILEQIRKIQRSGLIEPSKQLEGRYNLSVEMETGVGKTYTYIKTMYELNKRYGWSKFIIVVPSVAIREGVYKSFSITEEHFKEEYGEAIRYFIYNSTQLTEIDRFASDSKINAMIINSQAFNARGKDARRIYMKLDDFRSRRPIDIIAKTNPILIIDEPQSVEGAVTKERLREFNPLFTLRYSATHKKDSVYNMIYRLDAMEAYNKKLVKKIAVKGISVTGSTATESYVYLESINLSKGNPTATIEFDTKGRASIRKARRVVGEGFNLYPNSGELAEYKNGFTVMRIDGRDSSIEFANGIKLFAGDVIGAVSEAQMRRIQIRETILSHLERERQLFYKGIKVLSLFFIDEVAKYKQYNEAGQACNGEYADMFEEEYRDIVGADLRVCPSAATQENETIAVSEMQRGCNTTAIQNVTENHSESQTHRSAPTETVAFQNVASVASDYHEYLRRIDPADTHAGYFSIDKKSNRMVDGKLGDKKERTSDDADAYDLIMKNKERLLDRAEPVRFIFSHSALREGWDNPNVFQICTLKQSGSDVRKRQEVGRGLRLSVNLSGERMDVGSLYDDVHNINVLTVVASESYDSFAKGLQTELAEAVAARPRMVTADLFKNKVIHDKSGVEQVVDLDLAQSIYEGLITSGYVKKGVLTDKYYEDKKNGTVEIAEEAEDCKDSVIAIIDSIYDARSMQPDNARKNNVQLEFNKKKYDSAEFKELWSRISSKSVYVVEFDEDELINKAISALDRELRVSKIYFKIEKGQMEEIQSREQLQFGESFVREAHDSYKVDVAASSSVKYDLIGKIVAETGLTRHAVVAIMCGIQKPVFEQFGNNPEEFIIKAADVINEQTATVIIQHITYDKLDAIYDSSIFTEPTLKGQLGVNAMAASKHLYDYILFDSANEKSFAEQIDTSSDVAVYVKLPSGFYISTPVGKYNPDWAIAFHEGKVKHIYFVAETKGSMSSMQLRLIEEAKIHCAREHFKAISTGSVVYDVVDSYGTLMDKVMKR